jgi:mono/diheme cytochrome c family protein
VNWSLADRGRSIYIEHCESCHGVYGRPATAAVDASSLRPRDLAAASFPMDDARLAVVIRHDREGMPRLDRAVTDADVQALRSLSARARARLAPAAIHPRFDL